MFCLVAVYMAVGENLRPYMADLPANKVSLAMVELEVTTFVCEMK